jgi:hypothetical protein
VNTQIPDRRERGVTTWMMLLYRPYARDPQVTEFPAEPARADVEATLGGFFERVPGFFSIDYKGAVRRCVALCPKEGKSAGLPLNVAATILWDESLRRDVGVGLIRPDGARADHLAGPVAVIFPW